MINFDIISAVPELLESPFQHSIIKRAIKRDLISINIINLRAYGLGKHNQIDDYQYGGGAGMVMMPEPLDHCILDLKKKKKYDEVIYMTPDGKKYNQKMANFLSLGTNLMIVCGHYKGIDQRIRDLHITLEISIGDFVLSGGELGAAVLVDSIGRLIPGVLNDEASALTDSFQDDLLAPPIYTRPAEYKGLKVPDVLLSGNEALISKWRDDKAYQITKDKRPDLINNL